MDPNLLEFWKSAPEDPFDAFFEHAPVLMHSIDATGHLTKVSRFWAAHLGYDPSEMIGRKSVDFLTPESRKHAIEEVLPEYIETGVIREAEYDFVRKDGSTIPVLLSASTVLDAEGQFVRSLAVIFDNSEAKRALEAARIKAQEAEEASQAKSQFLAAMSHEIRTPMNVILGFAQLLKQANLEDARAKQVDAIISSGKSLMGLLTDLLDFNEAETGQMRIERRAFFLPELIDGVTDLWATEARAKGLEFTVTTDSGTSQRIITDETRLRQVLNNLLANAIKFTDTGRVDLRITETLLDDAQSRLCFEVRDTGCGLDPEQIEKLFQPFVRMEQGNRGNGDGWGLGLSICHRIAEALDGRLWVDSTPGKGATFYFDLTVGLAASAPPRPDIDTPPRPEHAPNGATALRVLLVEDNVLTAEMMRMSIESLGHAVTWAADGLIALNIIHTRPFDLAFMDMMMPGPDGIETTRRIRASDGINAEVPIIACTALVSEETEAQCRAAGMNGFLPKPVNRTKLDEFLNHYSAALAHS